MSDSSQHNPSPHPDRSLEPGTPAWRERVAALSRPLEQLPPLLAIPPVTAPFHTTICPPGSKSLTNRALLLAAIAKGESTLAGALIDADDAQVMLAALRTIGAAITIEPATSTHQPPVVRITGVGGMWKTGDSPVTLNLNNAGTATRFLTAAAILAPPGSPGIIIDGNARMRERPIRELADALTRLGVLVQFQKRDGFPPVRILPPADLRSLAPVVEFPATASSQFISALLLVAPLLPSGLTIVSREPVTSRAYIDMSRSLMQRLGVRFAEVSPRAGETLRLSVPHQPLGAFSLEIEPDASGATYFEAAAALIPGASCQVQGLDLSPVESRSSLQGDTQFVRVISACGARVERTSAGIRVTGGQSISPMDADLSDMPDTAMTAAVLACFARPTPTNPRATTVLHGLRTLRVKETDRLAALQAELSKLGALVEIVPEVLHDREDEALRITPPAKFRDGPIEFATYDDHRMAMALALVGLRLPGVSIHDPACVRKTYPNFFQDLANICA